MKNNIYTAIGLMSGTSMDGVDASLIRSDGVNEFSNILDKFYEFDDKLYQKLINLRNLINNNDNLSKYSMDLNKLERDLTIFHSKIINRVIKEYKGEIDLIGFHGQTIFHNPKIGITKQIGDGKLLSQLTKKKVVYNFRQEDIDNGGQGAPLAPIFHNLLSKILNVKNKINFPICFLNIGGISNITITTSDEVPNEKFRAFDVGPGNCLIDKWIRKNSDKFFDDNGNIAKKGKIDKFIFDQYLDNYYYSKVNSKRSLDTNDFDISFAKGLSLENGTTTITDLTSELLSKKIGINDIYICGGGRKNKYLINSLKKKINNKLRLIDDLNIDGDYIESQAFAFLAIRSYLGLPNSFPSTTNCKEPTVGGNIIKNS